MFLFNKDIILTIYVN